MNSAPRGRTPAHVWRFFHRLRIRGRGRLSTSTLASELVALALIVAAHAPFIPLERRLHYALVASRRTSRPLLRGMLARLFRPHLTGPTNDIWRRQRIGWRRYEQDFGGLDQPVLSTSLVLKEPGPDGEKGVLYASFEYNWMRLLVHARAREFLRDYTLVGASSWSPPDYASFAAFAGLSEDPIFIGISNPADMDAYQVMAPVVAPLPLMACDWCDPSDFAPRPHDQREIDILMVANWMPFKRHWLLFEALRGMPANLRVVLIGRDAPGRTAQAIRTEAQAFGVPQQLELHTNIPFRDVIAMLCNARVSVLCSRREGSCVSVAESMFADTPVVMMRDAHVGAKAHINEHTGLIAERSTLRRDLLQLLERGHELHPREWAVANISCHRSSQRLNDILREDARQRGRPWVTDIAPLCWRYDPAYVCASDEQRLSSARQRLAEEYGVRLAAPPQTPS